MDEALEIQFLVSTNVLQMKDIGSLKIGLKITNTGTQSRRVDVSKSKLYVNGVRNLAWDLRVQNGAIINLKVPAGQSKIEQWNLGKALFSTTGIYELELLWDSLVIKQTVIVTN